MPITFHIPSPLRPFAGGLDAVEFNADARTLGEALRELWVLYPGVRDRVETERGEVRQHVHVFVGNESVRYTGGLATPVSDGAEIFIAPAVSGG